MSGSEEDKVTVWALGAQAEPVVDSAPLLIGKPVVVGKMMARALDASDPDDADIGLTISFNEPGGLPAGKGGISAFEALDGGFISRDHDTGAFHILGYGRGAGGRGKYSDFFPTIPVRLKGSEKFLHSPALESVTDGVPRDRRVARSDLVDCILDLQKFVALVVERWPAGEVYIDEFEFALEISTGNAVNWVLGAKGGATIKLKVDRKPRQARPRAARKSPAD